MTKEIYETFEKKHDLMQWLFTKEEKYDLSILPNEKFTLGGSVGP